MRFVCFQPFPFVWDGKESRLFGRFNKEVIDERIKATLDLLDHIGLHAHLFTSPVFVDFFKDGIEYTYEESVQLSSLSLIPETISERSIASNAENDLSLNKTSEESLLFDPLKANSHDQSSSSSFNSFAPNSFNDRQPTTSFTKTNNLKWLFPERDVGQQDDVLSVNKDSNGNFSIYYPEPFHNYDIPNTRLEERNIDLDELILDHFDQSSNTLSSQDQCSPPELPKEGSISVHKDDNQDLFNDIGNETYLMDAAILIGQAQIAEDSSDYDVAFESYKCAIGILMEGVKNESSKPNADAIKKKIHRYLKRAEIIYNQNLSDRIKKSKNYSLVS